MDEPARKRRRTNSPDERAPSPLRKPPRRPSFASPTKATLARSYPNLLPPKTNGNDKKAQRQQTNALEEEDTDLPTPPRREQNGPRRGMLFSPPGKKPSAVRGLPKESSPLSRAPPVESSYLSRSVDDSADGDRVDNVATQDKQLLDPEVETRKREKARLEREIKELEAQVSRCTEEIVKEQQRGPESRLKLTERKELTDFIIKTHGTDTNEEQGPLVSNLLCSFLPFAGLSILSPVRKHESKPILSHRPIDLADPLPYLQMFTSLTFSTQLGLPRGMIFASSNRVHQKNTIDIAGPQTLLTAQLSIIIDALANEIIDMNIIRLSIWADRELGTFLRKKAKEKDLGNACWAIDSYWEIATKRALYWHKCMTAFAHLIAGTSNGDAEGAHLKANPDVAISRKDMNRNLGRDTLVLQDQHVLLKINWRIGFDWTGEAESEVNVEPAFPRVWSEGDTSSAFSKIPETFTSLLQTRGAYDATRVMVSLLFAQ